MKKFAIHNNEKVLNVIIAETQETAESVTGLLAIETTGEPWIDWVFVENEWVAPVIEQIEELVVEEEIQE